MTEGEENARLLELKRLKKSLLDPFEKMGWVCSIVDKNSDMTNWDRRVVLTVKKTKPFLFFFSMTVWKVEIDRYYDHRNMIGMTPVEFALKEVMPRFTEKAEQIMADCRKKDSATKSLSAVFSKI